MIFNRPDLTERTVKAIVANGPSALYLACDGPRTECERPIVTATRELALKHAKHTRVHTLFQAENLGCKRAVERAISWFFANEQEGIILEDDCVPSRDFFRFADAMLERYRDDPIVMHVAGYCDAPSIEPSYRFSRYPPVWGWATWRRAWAKYESELPKMTPENQRALRTAFATRSEHRHFVDKWRAVSEGTLDTWDYSWCFAVMSNHALAVLPKQNLVQNAGIGDPRATHTKRCRSGAFDSTQPLTADPAHLVEPQFRLPDQEHDVQFFRTTVAGRLTRFKEASRRLLPPRA
jgi:hypothetical protein